MTQLFGVAIQELWTILAVSVRDAYLQVSAFVAVTVLAFTYLEHRTGGQLVAKIKEKTSWQPVIGALMGLTPGCGGAIVMMPLYVRGVIGFGTVVATLIATAGDSAFVILTQAPQAALVSYGITFVVAIIWGYMVDSWGLGVGYIDNAVSKLGIHRHDEKPEGHVEGALSNKAHMYDEEDEKVQDTPVFMQQVSQIIHRAWWVLAAVGLVVGTYFLFIGAPDVPFVFGLSFNGLFTIIGVAGTLGSFFLYWIGRTYLGRGHFHADEDTSGPYQSFLHAAMETSFVTVWVVAAYLIYEYFIVFTGADVAGLAQAVGLWAPVAGALIGIIPGCGPQIVLASAYAQGGIPFSALTANAISQDGDALFPLLAIDKKASIVATLYTTIPALIVGLLLHLIMGPMLGYGILGS